MYVCIYIYFSLSLSLYTYEYAAWGQAFPLQRVKPVCKYGKTLNLYEKPSNRLTCVRSHIIVICWINSETFAYATPAPTADWGRCASTGQQRHHRVRSRPPEEASNDEIEESAVARSSLRHRGLEMAVGAEVASRHYHELKLLLFMQITVARTTRRRN